MLHRTRHTPNVTIFLMVGYAQEYLVRFNYFKIYIQILHTSPNTTVPVTVTQSPGTSEKIEAIFNHSRKFQFLPVPDTALITYAITVPSAYFIASAKHVLLLNNYVLLTPSSKTASISSTVTIFPALTIAEEELKG